jgi:hypothetical protein
MEPVQSATNAHVNLPTIQCDACTKIRHTPDLTGDGIPLSWYTILHVLPWGVHVEHVCSFACLQQWVLRGTAAADAVATTEDPFKQVVQDLLAERDRLRQALLTLQSDAAGEQVAAYYAWPDVAKGLQASIEKACQVLAPPTSQE